MDAFSYTPAAPPQHRRPFIVAAAIASILVLIVSLIWVAAQLQASKLDRWLPERAGYATVLGKIQRGDELQLRIRLDVPAATPAEAVLIPERTENRDAMIAARTLDTTVHVDRAQWDDARPGARVRAIYHINVQRSEAFVPTVYLDAMNTGQQ